MCVHLIARTVAFLAPKSQAAQAEDEFTCMSFIEIISFVKMISVQSVLGYKIHNIQTPVSVFNI